MISGLVSVSFRQLSPLEIARLCEKAELNAIEWGGDIHVPAGDIKTASEVSKITADYGMKTVSYGSYYRLGQDKDAFMRNLETACRLGAPVMRIWAGNKGSALCDDMEYELLVSQMEHLREIGQSAGVDIAPEFHIDTLTDSISSLARLLMLLPSQKFYWQPRYDWTLEERLESLKMIGDRLTYIHAFSWKIDGGKEIRLPLKNEETMWKKIIESQPESGIILMEFVKNDNRDILLADAKDLNDWIRETKQAMP